LINDQYQGRGIGTELARRLLEVARNEKLARIVARMSSDNYAMMTMCRSLGFKVYHAGHGELTEATIDL
jgi:acetyltransferase